MSTPKYWGTIRKVLTGLSNQFISVNEDMEAISVHRLKQGLAKGDLHPRVYTFPEMEVNIECRASMNEGKVKLLGLKGSESEEDMVSITIRAPFVTSRLNSDQLETIIRMNEDEVEKLLEDRGIEAGGGSTFFIPDEE